MNLERRGGQGVVHNGDTSRTIRLLKKLLED